VKDRTQLLTIGNSQQGADDVRHEANRIGVAIEVVGVAIALVGDLEIGSEAEAGWRRRAATSSTARDALPEAPPAALRGIRRHVRAR